MYLNAARLGFKPELPVHFSTWNWNAGNKTQANIIPILDESTKLRIASIYIVTSVSLIATTPIPLGEFL
jgi:hypothetical protein